jgi:predicted protein tyrosine phosphatase
MSKVNMATSLFTQARASLYSYTAVARDKIYQYLYDRNTTMKTDRLKPENSIMSQVMGIINGMNVVTDNIYIGSAYDAADYDYLKRHDITRIINITREIPNYFKDTEEFEYLHIPVSDINGETLIPHYDSLLEFYNKNKTDNILIHCYMGSSRSACAVLLYLTVINEMCIEEALELLTSKRDIVNINIDFYNELDEYLNTKDESIN